MSESSVPHASISQFAQTRPWAFCCVILGFLGAVITVIGGVMVMTGLNPQAAMMPSPMPIVLGVVYIIMAFIQLIPTIMLLKFVNASKQLQATQDANSLLEAARGQRMYWKTIGIFAIVYIALVVVIIALAMVGAVVSAAA